MARADLSRPAPDLLEGLLDGLRRSKIELCHLEAPPHEVHVRVEPARGHEPAAQIDALGSPGIAREVRRTPDRDHAAIPREQRLGRDTGSDVDPAAVEQRRRH